MLFKHGFIRMTTVNPDSHRDRRSEHQDAKVLSSGNCGVTKQDADKPERCAGNTQYEIEFLFAAAREPREYRQDNRHDSINDEHDHTRNVARSVEGDCGSGRSKSAHSKPQEKNRVDERDQCAFAITENGELVHVVGSVSQHDFLT